MLYRYALMSYDDILVWSSMDKRCIVEGPESKGTGFKVAPDYIQHN